MKESAQQRYDALRASAEAAWRALESSALPRLIVQLGSCSQSVGADRVFAALARETARRGIAASVERVGCGGMCFLEPIVEVQLPGTPRVMYGQVTPARVPELLQSVVQAGKHRSDWAFAVRGAAALDGIPPRREHPFVKPQAQHVMHWHSYLDPQNVEHYIAHGGYRHLARALAELKPEDILAEVNASSLVGRGGAAFPTGRKWETAMKAPGRPKFMFCNGEEGEPAIYKDRRILEADPHSVLEGMLIAGYTIGCTKGYVYVGGEHALAARRVQTAIDQLYQHGLAGPNILGSAFSCDLELRVGAGSYAVGESSAMMNSLEGRRGMPRPKLVRSAEKGVWALPTNMNNVETYANIPLVFEFGGAAFSSIGTSRSTGTKLLAPSGHLVRPGLVEVPFGTPMRTVVFDICGGVPAGRAFKFAQPAGPTGASISEKEIDVKLSNEDMAAAGSVLGSGGLVIFDDSTCVVDFGKYLMQFNAVESCTRCTTCRLGTARLTDIFNRLSRGEGQVDDLDTIRWLGPIMIETTLCGLGQAAPIPAIGLMDDFRDEFLAHIEGKRCSAGVCRELADRTQVDDAKLLKISI